MSEPTTITLRDHEARAAAAGRLSLIVRPVVNSGDSPSPMDSYATDGRRVHTPCPLGTPGARLAVRETFGHDGEGGICYAADYPAGETNGLAQWLSSARMPRWASRMALVVESVEVRRAWELTDRDASAAGMSWYVDARLSSSVGLDKWARRAVVNAQREGKPRPSSAGMRAAMSIQMDRDFKAHPWRNNPWCWFVRVRVENTKGDSDGER